MAESPERRDGSLKYPPIVKPEGCHLQEVCSGVFWLRMPLPFSLNHINLWLLEDGDGWTLVDTGLANDQSIEIWQSLFENDLKSRPLKRLIVTHMHPDHLGLAGWISEKSGAPLHISRSEYLMCRSLLQYSHEQVPADALAFYRGAGFDTEQLDLYRSQFGGFGRMMRGLPHSYVRLQERDYLHIGNRQWQVVIGEGHSPEHVCLYCEQDNLFISGDQLLPTISSNVSVWPSEPFADPLNDWLLSCHKLKSMLNNETLIMPAHGKPFYGAIHRLQQLIDEHENDLTSLIEFCEQPRRAVDCFSVLFRAKINRHNLMMATGESIAHLNCLYSRGQLERHFDGEGLAWYQKVNR